MTCEHGSYTCEIDVLRLVHKSDGSVSGYEADIRIRCAQCQVQFIFTESPQIDADATTITLPIKPSPLRLVRT